MKNLIFVALLCLIALISAKDIKIIESKENIEKAPICEVCKFAVEVGTKYINGSRDEILGKLNTACEKLPEGADKICKTFVALYGNELIDFIVEKGKNPKEFCQSVKLCPTFEHMSPEAPLCELCKFVVKTAMNYINGSADEILEKLNEQCEKLPDGLDKICKTFVTLYGKDLIEWIVEKGNNPTEFCGSIGLCGREDKIIAIEWYHEAIEPKGPLCEVCQFVVKTAMGFINGSADEIIEKLNKQCEKLPDGVDKICKTFVTLYGKDLIEWIVEKGNNPREFCGSIGLCSAQPQAQAPALTKKAPVCELCKFVVKTAMNYINGSADEIIEQLKTQCERLPDGVDKVCKTFVMLYGRDLIEWVIEKGNNPHEFCASIGLCNAENKMTIEEFMQNVQKKGQLCTMCQFVVKTAMNYINGSADEIIEKLNQQCEKLPSGIDKMCKTVVTLYGRDLIEWIVEKGNNPREFCGSIGLCSNEVVKQDKETACKVCQFVAGQFKNIVNSTNDDEIIEQLNNVCEKLPDGADKVCKTFVALYAKELIDWVRQNTKDPKALCVKIGLCEESVFLKEIDDEIEMYEKINGRIPEWLKKKARCIAVCLAKKFFKVSIGKIIRVIKRCEKDVMCYVNIIGPHVKDCVKACI